MQGLNCSRSCWVSVPAAWGRRHMAVGPRAQAPFSPGLENRKGGSLSRLLRREARHRQVQVVAAAAAAVFTPELPALDDSYEARCTFADFSNWLLPGRVMLGRYPYVEPSRCRSVDKGEEQLKQILEAGITTFVCLQDELPPQDELRIGGKDGFLPYRATATLLASALSDPPSLEEISALRTPQLDKFLPPRRKGPSPASLRRRIELDFVHSPIVDLGIPEEERLVRLLDDLAARVQRGESLYIHCWGGRGRAGTVGACLLAKLYGLGGDEALERVDRAFSTRQDGANRSPETAEQRQFVLDFIARM